MNLNGFVNKNFVVRNGLEVSENLIYADDQQRRIGVGIITARYDLDVIGGIGATNVTSEGSVVTGLSTSNNNKIDGYISVGGTTGTNGQYLISTGQGLQWFTLPAVRENTYSPQQKDKQLSHLEYHILLV